MHFIQICVQVKQNAYIKYLFKKRNKAENALFRFHCKKINNKKVKETKLILLK